MKYVPFIFLLSFSARLFCQGQEDLSLAGAYDSLKNFTRDGQLYKKSFYRDGKVSCVIQYDKMLRARRIFHYAESGTTKEIRRSYKIGHVLHKTTVFYDAKGKRRKEKTSFIIDGPY